MLRVLYILPGKKKFYLITCPHIIMMAFNKNCHDSLLIPELEKHKCPPCCELEIQQRLLSIYSLLRPWDVSDEMHYLI